MKNRVAAYLFTSAMTVLAVVPIYLITYQDPTGNDAEAARKAFFVSHFKEEEITIIGKWANEGTRLRLFKNGDEFYTEFKTKNSIYARGVTTKNGILFYDPLTKDTWIIDRKNIIQSQMKNKDASIPSNKRLVVFESIEKW